MSFRPSTAICAAPPLTTIARGLLALLLAPLLMSSGLSAAEVVPAKPEVPFLEVIAKSAVIDEVNLGTEDPGHRFTQEPGDASTVSTVEGVATRVMANQGDGRYFAVRLGEGKNLKALATYVLEVDLVEDAPRTFYIFNRGDDTLRGVACGASLSDSVGQYTSSNPEVLDVPLAKGVRTWRSVFRLHDRSGGLKRELGALGPDEGFWVMIVQPEAKRMPGSMGAAVSAVRLRAIEDPTALYNNLKRPPKELPWRHAFWREEMADGVTEPKDNKGTFTDPLEYYKGKFQTMRILGYDTFGKDLLEFGYNQGWDSSAHGGSEWVNQPDFAARWAQVVELAGKAKIPVLPYYEYCGSIGTGDGSKSLGPQRRAKTLGGQPTYTQIEWTERANVDITDPDTLDDFAKIVDCTVLKLKDKAEFLGVWMRPRPSANPISFADATIERFTKATGQTGVTRERLKNDKELFAHYVAWWNTARRDFLVGVRDGLRKGGVKDATVLYTCCASEPAPVFMDDQAIVQGDPDPWRALLGKAATYSSATSGTGYLDAVLAFPGTWGEWEWNWASPPPDPKTYAKVEGITMTYPYRRAYSVAVPADMEAFRVPAGLAMLRHQSLNERSLPDDFVGYQCVDTERAGPASVLPDVMAVVNGDPRWMGILSGVSLTTGYPQYVRAFYAAYMSLPALPSKLLAKAADQDAVVVRVIDGGKHGTWLAVGNISYTALKGVTLKLPATGTVTDAATGEVLKATGKTLVIDLEPCSLRAIRITP